jgi:hypothetical protein
MTVSKTSVQAIDLDDLERQLREIAVASPANKSEDPLAELARLVGRDKSLRSLQGARDELRRVAPFPANVAKSALAGSQPANPRSDQSEFDLHGEVKQGLRRGKSGADHREDADFAPDQDELDEGPNVDEEAWEEESYPDEAEDVADEPNTGYDAVEQVPEMPGEGIEGVARKGILSPRALALAVPVLLVAVGVSAGVLMRSGPHQSTAETPIIKADSTPVKVAPASAAGDDQTPAETALDAADPSTKPSQVVVARPEQPVDVVAAARAAQPPARGVQPPPSSGVVIVSGPGPAPAAAQTPAAAPMPTAAANVPLPDPPPASGQGSIFGTPRRVATVSVKPDGTIVSSGKPKADAPVSPAPPIKPLTVASADAETTAPAPVATGSVTPAPKKPADTTRAKPSAGAPSDDQPITKPKPPAKPKTKVADATPVAAEAPDAGAPMAITPSGRHSRSVASAPPPSGQPAATAPEPSANAAGGEGFSIQVASSPSESEARATLSRLQKQFPDTLGGGTVRRADLGSKGVFYRVRVGPLTRDAADKLCSQLKASGAACILTRG